MLIKRHLRISKMVDMMKKRLCYFVVVVQILFLLVTICSYFRTKSYDETITADKMNISDFGVYNTQDNTIENKNYEADSESTMILNAYAEGIKSGIYDITIIYKTNSDGNTLTVSDGTTDNNDILSDTLYLDNNALGESEFSCNTMRIWVNDYVGRMRLDVNNLCNGDIAIKSIRVCRSGATLRVRIMNIFIVFAVFDLLCLFLFHYCSLFGKEKKKVFVSLFLIVFIASIPVFSNRLINGDDFLFHVPRIQGIIEGILSGQFPVKLQPNWWNGLGYNVSYFYGDLFLYFPALLYLFGYPFQVSYQIFIVFINLITCISMYLSVKKMFKSTDIAIVGSALYTLSTYRLLDIYHRFAVGEYVAMTFLPIVVYGFWIVFSNYSSDNEKKVSPLIIAFSLSCVIQSHVLSCEMIAICIFFVCIICIKRVFTKDTFKKLLSALFLTFMLNLWFLVPFICSVLSQKGFIYSSDEAEYFQTAFQGMGAELYEIMEIFPNGQISGISPAIGLPLIITLVIYIYQRVISDKTVKKEFVLFGDIMSLGAIIAIVLSLKYIPYSFFIKRIPFIATILGTLQFPWRFMTVATVFLSFTACVVLTNSSDEGRVLSRRFIGTILLSCAVVISINYVNSFLTEEETIKVYDAGTVRTLDGEFAIGKDYVNGDVDIAALSHEIIANSDKVKIDNQERKLNLISFNAKSSSEYNETIYVPLLYFDGYEAISSNNDSIELNKSENGAVEISIPAWYSGTITVKYKEKIIYRIMEIISLLSWIYAIFILLMVNYYRNRKIKSH